MQRRAASRSAWRKSASEGVPLGADAGDARGDAPRRRQQEVARAAGRVDHGELQQGLGRVVCFRLGPLQHRVEGRVEERLNQAVRRVVGAGGLALVALLLGEVGGKDEGAAIVGKLRLELEQGFVNRTKLLGLHCAPVDRHHAAPVGKPGEAIDRLHEGAVAQAAGLQMGQLIGAEETAERGEAERILAGRERAEDDLHALVAVVVTIPGRAAHALRPERGEAVALGIERARVVLGVGGVEEIPVLGHHQKDEAVDEAQELVEPGGQRQRARA